MPLVGGNLHKKKYWVEHIFWFRKGDGNEIESSVREIYLILFDFKSFCKQKGYILEKLNDLIAKILSWAISESEGINLVALI